MTDRRLLHPRLLLIALCSVAPLTPASGATRLIGPNEQCLGVEGSPRQNARVVLEACTNAADQAWKMPPRGFSGRAEVDGFCLEAGPTIQVGACNGSAAQAWRHGTDQMLAAYDGRCLIVPELVGQASGLAECDGRDRGLFRAETQNQWEMTSPRVRPVPLIPTGDPQIVYSKDWLPSYFPATLKRSEDAGRSFASPSSVVLGLGLVSVDAVDPNHVWANAEASDQTLASFDGGKSWRVVLNRRMAAFWQSPGDPRRVLIASSDRVWSSMDGGSSFAQLGLPVPGSDPVVDLSEGLDGQLFVTRHQPSRDFVASPATVYRSWDDGQTWQISLQTSYDAEENGSRSRVWPHPTRAEVLYFMHPRAWTTEFFFRSLDGGNTWHQLPLPRNDGARFESWVAATAPDSLWYRVDSLLFRSEDRGETWVSVQPNAEHDWLFDGAMVGGNLFFLARSYSDSNVCYRSVDGGYTWSAVAPLGLHGAAGTVAVASRPGRYYLNQFSTGLWRTDDSGRTWAHLGGNPWSEVFTDPLNRDGIYRLGFHPHGNSSLSRSLDAGETFETLATPPFAREAAAVAVGAQTVLVAGSGSSFFRSLDHGSSWVPLTFQPSSGWGTSLIVDHSVLYALARPEGRVFSSLDGGETWSGPKQAPCSEPAFGGGRIACARVDGGGNFRLELSDDQGSTFRPQPPPFDLSWGDSETSHIFIDQFGTVFLQDDTGRLWQQPVGRTGWELIHQGLGGDGVDSLVADPYHPGRLLAMGRDSGLLIGNFGAEPKLALGGGRFEASLTWDDGRGGSGRGVPTSLTDDTGLFWLFTAERSEVAVKILDGRALDGHFWVFVASLSDVAFEIEIVDRASGERRLYRNPLKTLASIADTSAFPLVGREWAAAPLQVGRSSTAEPIGMVPAGDHFEVSATWRTANGETGEAAGLRLNHDTAGFYFFSQNNVELLVNVIDGRSINGHYWVFYASLTNVEFALSVRDLGTGVVKTYNNPLGTFASSADLTAFP